MPEPSRSHGTADVVVIGGGPAGAAAALRLASLGIEVLLVARDRNPTLEGLSARTLQLLRESGFRNCLSHVSAPVPRLVSWAGTHGLRGTESLVDRSRFDQGLIGELHGRLRVVRSAARRCVSDAGQWRIETHEGTFSARAVLDARGRHLRHGDSLGPVLASWGVRLRDGSPTCASAVIALDNGWCWIARTADGAATLQFVGSARYGLSRPGLQQIIAQVAERAGELGIHPGSTVEEGARVRAAAARFTQPASDTGYLRIGDAAIAADPLSGNGVHSALASARAGVAAINSYLNGSDWPIVARFVNERAAEHWLRGVSAAAGFYRSQADVSGAGFWQVVATAYERLAQQAAEKVAGFAAAAGQGIGPDTAARCGRFEARPVLNGERIEVRQVWVEARWPRGIWTVNGRELAAQASGAHVHYSRGLK